MRKLRKYIIASLSVFLICMPIVAVAEIKLAEPRIDSVIGQILDIKIPLIGDTADVRLLNHSAGLYAELGIAYTDTSERIVMELVTTVGEPYVAVSSIGALSESQFELVVGLNTPQGEVTRRYSIVLSKPSPPPVIVSALSPAEVMLELLDYLSLANNQPRLVILSQLYRISGTGSSSAMTKKMMIFKFGKTEFNDAFINGFQKLLDDKMQQSFLDMRKKQGTREAVYFALFDDDKHTALKKLLSHSTISSFADTGNSAQRLTFMKERVAILENQMMHLQKMVEDSKETSLQTTQPALTERIYAMVEWLKRQWRVETLLSRDLWMSISIISLLLFFMIVRRQLRQRKESAVTDQRTRKSLPGQRSLEKEIGLANVASTPSDEKINQLDSKLNLASMYIEMGDNASAIEVLNTVISKGNQQQIERAQILKKKVKGNE